MKKLRVKFYVKGRQVWVNGNRIYPGHSQKVRNHSPDGFNWGYGGSGPAQTALAILLHVGIPEQDAQRLYQQFKWDFVSRQPFNQDVEFEVDLDDWLEKQGYSILDGFHGNH